ncbi:MAG: translation initiation factor 2 [Oscillospiraceae bacterium]|nr:translation initiation factor 2 [Oscillospiraceae bacterium]
MAYDMKCPVCGTVNHGLNLDETEGRMICERCGTETQDVRFRRFVKRPARRADMFVRPGDNGENRRAE